MNALAASARRARRPVFFLYAVALFTATHWPKLEVPPMGMERSDLLVHMGVFGCWTVLFNACEFTGSWRRARVVALNTLIAAVYAAIDEGLQAIPALRRTAAWDDLAANLLGVLLGSVLVLIAGAYSARRQDPRS